MKSAKLLCALLLSMWMIQAASAGVIDSADVNGFKTFRDTSTNRIWLDMNNFFDATASNGSTGLQMIAAAESAGFVVASREDVSQLLGSLPLGGGQWAGYAAVMGYGIPRQLIWGMYDDGGDPGYYGWAFAFSTYTNWGYADETYDPSTRVNVNLAGSSDLGLFAYRADTSNQVPEPDNMVLMSLGLAALLAARHRKLPA
jgi:hypothetical protein